MFSFFKFKKTNNQSITKDFLLEKLLSADVEYDLAESLIETCPNNITREKFAEKIDKILPDDVENIKIINSTPLVYLIIGVNGAGKTTTIAKLGAKYKSKGKKVIFGAGDTFRAAAVEQLQSWGKRLNIALVNSKFGADPSSVAFDTISAATARCYDVALIDTAGRLDNKTNLKNELIKISNTCCKALNNGDFYKLLIIDGTQGTQSISQAKIFNNMLGIDGIIITKLDGNSKGGSILSMLHSLNLPILYVGIGEGENDLMEFSLDWYKSNLLDFIFS